MSMLASTRRVLLQRASRVTYELRADFNAADQGYANGQVLDTPGEGVLDGELTVVEVDGTLALSGNKCAFTAQGTPTWGDLGFYSQAITRELGKALLATINLPDAEKITGIGWRVAQEASLDVTNNRYSLYIHTDNLRVGWATATALDLASDVVTDGNDYELAIVLGGYDSNSQPYYAGQPLSNYLYGASFFIKGTPEFTDWALIWRTEQNNTATLYAVFANYDAAGDLTLAGDGAFRVPDLLLPGVLQPLALSTFTAANGTSLDAITPEVGGAWTEDAGDWEIQSNKVQTATFGNGNYATMDAGISDLWVAVDATPQETDASNHAAVNLMLRESDSTHYWLIQASGPGNKISLYENDAGFTERASSAVAVVGGTTYSIVGVCNGQTIDGFLDGANKVTYGSAAMNETATNHGISERGSGTPPAAANFNNFHIHPLTDVRYNALDEV